MEDNVEFDFPECFGKLLSVSPSNIRDSTMVLKIDYRVIIHGKLYPIIKEFIMSRDRIHECDEYVSCRIVSDIPYTLNDSDDETEDFDCSGQGFMEFMRSIELSQGLIPFERTIYMPEIRKRHVEELEISKCNDTVSVTDGINVTETIDTSIVNSPTVVHNPDQGVNESSNELPKICHFCQGFYSSERDEVYTMYYNGFTFLVHPKGNCPMYRNCKQ